MGRTDLSAVGVIRLVPELKVSDLGASRAFYVDALGFEVAYERPEERFVYLDRAGAELMLEEIQSNDRVEVAPLERPFGRGVNLQIECPGGLSGYPARYFPAGTSGPPREGMASRRGGRAIRAVP